MMLSGEDAVVAANGGRVTFDASQISSRNLKSLTTQVAVMRGSVTICKAELLAESIRNELSILGCGKVSFEFTDA
ncbi:MAG: hypothetical protein ACE5I3_05785 [Phycisphaerae bacterium]